MPKYAAMFSGAALAVSISTLMYVDRQNDQDLVDAVDGLLKADEAADARVDKAACESAADARFVVITAFNKLGSLVPDSPEKADLMTFLRECLKPRDCAAAPVVAPAVPDHCLAFAPTPAAEG